MAQEDIELLFKDLCARLPYGVKVCAGEDLAMTLKQIDYKCFCESWENEDLKCHSRWMFPYLRPMSSMTEEEKKEFESLGWRVDELNGNVPWNHNSYNVFDGVNWLNAHHFDYRTDDEGKTMIEKGLALEAPKGMYK